MLSDLFEHNARWAAGIRSSDPAYFERLAALQRPEYLWIGCSDSRVPANVVTGLQPGEVFVHRNIANLVHRSDLNLLSVLEFAVETLEVRHIIVCGHYGCGGVRAAMDEQRHGVVDHWLQPVRDLAEAHLGVGATGNDPEQLDLLCELNIRAQVDNLCRTPILRAAWAQGMPIEVHGWVYGLSDGLLRDLHCDRMQMSDCSPDQHRPDWQRDD